MKYRLAAASMTSRSAPAWPHGTTTGQFHNEYADIMAGYTALGASAAADYDGDGFEDLFVTDSAADGMLSAISSGIITASELGSGSLP